MRLDSARSFVRHKIGDWFSVAADDKRFARILHCGEQAGKICFRFVNIDCFHCRNISPVSPCCQRFWPAARSRKACKNVRSLETRWPCASTRSGLGGDVKLRSGFFPIDAFFVGELVGHLHVANPVRLGQRLLGDDGQFLPHPLFHRDHAVPVWLALCIRFIVSSVVLLSLFFAFVNGLQRIDL